MNEEEKEEQNSKKVASATRQLVHTKNPTIPLSDAQRAECKRIFLDTMGKCWIVQMSCDAAGVSRSAYDYWRRTGYLTQEELDEAYAKWQDVLRGELVKVGIIGLQTPLIHNGRIALEPDGRKAFINRRDNRVLTDLASRYLPEWADYKDKNITVTTQENDGTIQGIPKTYALVIDSRKLSPAQFDIILSIAEDLEQQERAAAAVVVVESVDT